MARCSVIIPAYGMGGYIGNALDGLLKQSFTDWELIVVDDHGPEDGTFAEVEKLRMACPDRRICYIRHKSNLGVCAARKTAISACKGEFIAFLDADDVFHPDKLARQISVMDENPSVVLSHTAVECTGEDEMISADGMADWFRISQNDMAYHLSTRGGIMIENRICNSSVLCRRSALSMDDLPDAMVLQFEDKFLWSKLSVKGGFHYTSDPLVRYRVHNGSFTSRILSRKGAAEMGEIELCLRMNQTHCDSFHSMFSRFAHLWNQLRSLAGYPSSASRGLLGRRIMFDMVLVLAGVASLGRGVISFLRGK